MMYRVLIVLARITQVYVLLTRIGMASICVLQDAAAFCPSVALQVNVPLREEEMWAPCVSNLRVSRNESIVMGSFNGAQVMTVCDRSAVCFSTLGWRVFRCRGGYVAGCLRGTPSQAPARATVFHPSRCWPRITQRSASMCHVVRYAHHAFPERATPVPG